MEARLQSFQVYFSEWPFKAESQPYPETLSCAGHMKGTFCRVLEKLSMVSVDSHVSRDSKDIENIPSSLKGI